MTFARWIFMILLASCLFACEEKPDLDSLRAEIVDLHRSFIQAHLDKDAAFLAKPTSPDYLAVINGGVQNVDAEEMQQRLTAYLDATEFSHYTDVAEPIVDISADGTVAWAIVQVRVAGDRAMSDGSDRSFDTLWAWLTLYRRNGDQWQRIVDVSTNRPWEKESPNKKSP